ncbi:hypothetical protein DL762_004994 [Monosporascus cannonballus]|uniref:Cytochrome P450 n=1 Tax=Monosporascus cannonballus TaxID=155416 RepID=A0ABY0H656_9PEZI|nr:hypothetical protein DL762_004994 [Monosporascus cannonballus]RYO96448.1 hypothetical protein DL763_003197 [Monosporascus cannonballus]
MASSLPGSVQAVAIASLLVTFTYLYGKLHYRQFKQNAHLPQLPSSLLFGHLMTFNKITKQGHTDRHPDDILAEMRRAAGQPPILVVDNWPVVPPMVIVSTYDVAEQVPIDVANTSKNERWKGVRKRFNPGFAHQHLMTLLPVIVEKSRPYLDLLDQLVQTGEAVPLDQLTTNLTFDIIGAVTMGEDMSAQHLDPSCQAYADDKLQGPWWMMPRVHLARRRLGIRISERLRVIVNRRWEEMKAGPHLDGMRSRSRSVLALSIQDIESLTPEIMEETCDQLKTFLFAGHDTTSTTIIWAIYELSRTPHALKAVHDELDRLFGQGAARDPAVVHAKLLAPSGDEIIRQMTYISAVLKEALRLHPPAGSIRMSKPGSGFVVKTSQGEYNLDGNWIYLNHHLIQRDRAVFGDTADNFVPERWLQSDGFPAGSWRPFERGPRNCIGQELANIEARVIVAMLARRFNFVKMGLGEADLDEHGQPTLNDKAQFKVKSELYTTIQISAKPVDGMLMKVKLAP